MTTHFGAIADDFTGATDLAALLARSGVPVSLRIGNPTEPPAATAPIEIIALKCRTSPVADAVAEARAALSWLQQAGATRFYWKYCSTFDSTANGNIGPVAEALMADLGVNQTIYCPAFPENGRSIYMGNLFVGEQLLAESPMKHHPLTPMLDSNLIRLLSPQVTRPVGLANRHVVASGASALRQKLASLAAQDVSHVVIDAVNNGDLHIIAEACRDMTLLTGGSAVAMPLPELWLKDGVMTRAPAGVRSPLDQGSAIILSGSCSAMTNQQVQRYIAQSHPAYRLDPIELARTGPEIAIEWLRAQSPQSAPIVYATTDNAAVQSAQRALGVEIAGQLVEDALAACAAAALESGARRFVIAGGETSGAVIKALGIDHLAIGREIAPGVPWCYAQCDDKAVAVTLKSGNFGTPTFFRDALDRLDGHE